MKHNYCIEPRYKKNDIIKTGMSVYSFRVDEIVYNGFNCWSYRGTIFKNGTYYSYGLLTDRAVDGL